MKPARKRAQAIAQGRGRGDRVVIPLAFEVAARISARPLDEFRNDPTQLANALGELQQAIGADGAVVALAGGMERAAAPDGVLDVERMAQAGPLGASLEACRRLRASHGDALALLAGITGPATLARQFGATMDDAAIAFGAVVKQFCGAGADVVLVFEDATESSSAYEDGLRTAANIARFHQASLLGWHVPLLPSPHVVDLVAPSASGTGIVTTLELVPADADIEALRQWVTTVIGPHD